MTGARRYRLAGLVVHDGVASGKFRIENPADLELDAGGRPVIGPQSRREPGDRSAARCDEQGQRVPDGDGAGVGGDGRSPGQMPNESVSKFAGFGTGGVGKCPRRVIPARVGGAGIQKSRG